MAKTITLTAAAAIKVCGIPANNFAVACKVFDDVERTTQSFAEALLKAGFADRKAARETCVIWYAKKYDVPIITSEREVDDGDGGKRKAITIDKAKHAAAYKAITRVLDAVYGSTVSFGAGKADNADPVASLLKRVSTSYGKLTAGQKRAFKAGVAKL